MSEEGKYEVSPKNSKINKIVATNNEVKPINFWIYSFNACTVSIYNESNINDNKSEFCFGVVNNDPVEESCTGTVKDLNLETKNQTIYEIRAVLIQKLGIYQGTAANLKHSLAIMPNKITKIEDNDSVQSDDITELLNRKSTQNYQHIKRSCFHQNWRKQILIFLNSVEYKMCQDLH